MNQYVKETYYFDYQSEAIEKIAAPFMNRVVSENLIQQLFEYTRDHWRYNPYLIGLTQEAFKSSSIAEKPTGHCIDKSIILISLLRKVGIPSRLKLAKVSNHLAVESLMKKLGSNEIAPHGIVELYFNGKWVKVSNAFNKELCSRFEVPPIEFDGTQDAVLQQYNIRDQKFMEYIEDFGSFDDVPFSFIVETFQTQYPTLAKKMKGQKIVDLNR